MLQQVATPSIFSKMLREWQRQETMVVSRLQWDAASRKCCSKNLWYEAPARTKGYSKTLPRKVFSMRPEAAASTRHSQPLHDSPEPQTTAAATALDLQTPLKDPQPPCRHGNCKTSSTKAPTPSLMGGPLIQLHTSAKQLEQSIA